MWCLAIHTSITMAQNVDFEEENISQNSFMINNVQVHSYIFTRLKQCWLPIISERNVHMWDIIKHLNQCVPAVISFKI